MKNQKRKSPVQLNLFQFGKRKLKKDERLTLEKLKQIAENLEHLIEPIQHSSMEGSENTAQNFINLH